MKACRQCEGIFPTDKYSKNYTNMHSGREYRQSVCRDCTRGQDLARRTLGKQHPRPEIGEPCACCGRIAKLVLDHDHLTLEFRGFICRECNVGIGYLGDDINGVERALKYLISVRSFRDASDIPIKKTNHGVRNLSSRGPQGLVDYEAMQAFMRERSRDSRAIDESAYDAIRTKPLRQNLCVDVQVSGAEVHSRNRLLVPRIRRVGSRVPNRAQRAALPESVDARTDRGDVPLAHQPEGGSPASPAVQDQPRGSICLSLLEYECRAVY